VSPIQTVAEVPYGSDGWRYKIVAFGEEQGFESPTFDDSNFAVGAGGFGPGCGNLPMGTPWDGNSDILLRRTFTLAPGSTRFQVGVAFDNDIQVFINGVDISGGFVTSEGCAFQDRFVFDVPEWLLHPGENVFALRGRDRGVVAYADTR